MTVCARGGSATAKRDPGTCETAGDVDSRALRAEMAAQASAARSKEHHGVLHFFGRPVINEPTKPTLLRLDTVLDRMGRPARTGLYKQIRDGAFPKPVNIGKRAVAWPSHEIDAVIAARIAGKSDADLRLLVASLTERRAQFAA